MNSTKLKSAANIIYNLTLISNRQTAFFIISFLCLSFPAIISVIKYFGDISMARGIVTALCGNMFTAAIVAIIISLCPFRWLQISIKFILYSLIILLTYVAAMLRFKFGRFITPSELKMLFETNPDETGNFIDTYITYNTIIISLSVILTVIVLTVTLEIYFGKKRRNHRPNRIIVCVLSICMLYGAYDMFHIWRISAFDDISRLETWTGSEYWRIDDRNGDPLSKLFYSIRSTSLSSKKVSEWRINNKKAFATHNVTHCDDNLKIVIAIGESFIKWHSPLYGYSRNTTPHMSSESSNGNLVAYNDVVCTKNSTIDMIHNILCTNDPTQNEAWYTYPYFPLLFASAGWDVYYWDNQTQIDGDTWIYNSTMTDFLFDDYLRHHCYKALYKNIYPYDGELIDDFAKSVKIGDSNELAIFHFIGQHFNATSRYPHTEDFCIFSGDDSNDPKRPWLNREKSDDIAEYDNATLYNDFVVSKLFDLYRDDNAVIVYFSDHGEEMYDYRNSQGRASNEDDLPNYLKYQHNIPFFVWMSDSFIERNSEMASRLRTAANTPFLSDNVSHLIMGIARMDSPYYRKERDPSSQFFIPSVRTVMGGSINYDEIMK